MIDFEVVNLAGPKDPALKGYAMQVSVRDKGEIVPKWYSVPFERRHLSRSKLIKLFDQGEFKAL